MIFVIVQHVLILRCMYVYTYVSHAWALGRHKQALRACRVVTWFARVSRGYTVCARARVAWYSYMVCLYSLIALALPRVAGSASFNAVAFTSYNYMCILYICIYSNNYYDTKKNTNLHTHTNFIAHYRVHTCTVAIITI